MRTAFRHSPSASSGALLLRPAEAADVGLSVQRGFSASEAAALSRAVAWTTTYPIQRVPKGKRTEAICPMLAPSIGADALWFSVETPHDPEDFASLDQLLRNAANQFHQIDGGNDPRLRCLVLVLPAVRGARLLEATSPERTIKGELLAEGILVGEFFPSCPFATTFNRRLYALRSPVTMVVFRTFLEGDWRFICRVPAWQQIYRNRFGEPPPKLRHLGGFWWRLKERVVWKIDTLLGRTRPTDPTGEGNPSQP